MQMLHLELRGGMCHHSPFDCFLVTLGVAERGVVTFFLSNISNINSKAKCPETGRKLKRVSLW